MATAPADTALAPAQDGGSAHERIVYEAGGGRKFFFSFVFLLLLPFFVSLPAMILMRLKAGMVTDTVGLILTAGAFALIMFLVFIELMHSLRTRVELGSQAMRLTLPSGRGPTPILRYKTYDVPYDQVHTVETRREIYGGALVPMLLQGARFITKDGQSVRLGYVSEANVDPAFPYPEIARKIAERARLPMIDRGSVRRSMRRKFFGLKSGGMDSDTVTDAQIASLNQSHSNVMLGLIGGLVVLMLVGIVDDIAHSSLFSSSSASVNAPAAAQKPAR